MFIQQKQKYLKEKIVRTLRPVFVSRKKREKNDERHKLPENGESEEKKTLC